LGGIDSPSVPLFVFQTASESASQASENVTRLSRKNISVTDLHQHRVFAALRAHH
jgi:hypothetical protein